MANGVCPFALDKMITPGSNDPAIKPRLAILHVADMLGPSLHDYFAYRSGGIESHFYVRLDGTIEQYRNIFWQADANLDANDFAVSIETEGKADGEWTEAQLEAIKRLLLWLNSEASIPLRKVGTWDGSGVGYHTLFGAPSHWTPVAKSCPGPKRKVQFEVVLVPWMNTHPERPPKVTKVQAARQKINAGIRQLRAVDGETRPAVKALRIALRETMNGGPKR